MMLSGLSGPDERNPATMTKRDLVKAALTGADPPYVPWSFRFTREPAEALSSPDRLRAPCRAHSIHIMKTNLPSRQLINHPVEP